jgi:hypothetical protein
VDLGTHRIFCSNELIAWCNFEGADPPMGVIHGELIPNENYQKYKHHFKYSSIETTKQPNFQIQTVKTNVWISSSVGMYIEDITEEMGEFAAIFTALGIDDFDKHFPIHSKNYANQFKY